MIFQSATSAFIFWVSTLALASACPSELVGTYAGTSDLTTDGLVFVGGCQPCESDSSQYCDYIFGQFLSDTLCEPAICGEMAGKPAMITIDNNDSDGFCGVTVTPDEDETCLGGANGLRFRYECEEVQADEKENSQQNRAFSCRSEAFFGKYFVVDATFTGMNLQWSLSGDSGIGTDLIEGLGGITARKMYGSSNKNRALRSRSA